MRAIRFKGGPADKHIAALGTQPKQFTFQILPPRHQPERRLVAVYSLHHEGGEPVYRYKGNEDA